MIHSRRELLKGFGVGASSMLLAPNLSLGHNAKPRSPFFLKVHFDGGWDPSYLMDARPKTFTQAKWIQNYHSDSEKAPVVFEGKNGRKTYVAQTAKSLISYMDSMSVINGLQVSSSDGHLQNLNAMITGNPFGGESFIPFLNTSDTDLDYLVTPRKFFGLQVSNANKSLTFAPDVGKKLADLSSQLSAKSNSKSALKYVRNRIQAISQNSPTGMLSKGSAELLSALNATQNLKSKLSKVELSHHTRTEINS